MADELDQGAGAPAAPVEPPSIRETLSSAFEEAAASDAGAAGAGAAAPATPHPGATPPKPAAPAQQQRAAAPTGDAARGADGKFIAKPPEAAQGRNEPTTPKPGAEPPLPETIGPPASWSAAAKADFKALPAHIQQEVLKRERDIETGKAQWQQGAERLNALDAVIAPRRDLIRARGLNDHQAVEALFAAQDMLERDAVSGLAFLARQYGVDLRRFAQGPPGQAAQQQPPMDPRLQQLAQQVNSLTQAQVQQQTVARQAVVGQLTNEVLAFRSDPSNPYFDNVREDMVALLQSGRAQDLRAAYDMAVWANAETRPIMQRAAFDQAEADRRAAAGAKAQAARYAAGSVTGSPAPGSSPASAGPAPSIGEELRRAMAAAS